VASTRGSPRLSRLLRLLRLSRLLCLLRLLRLSCQPLRLSCQPSRLSCRQPLRLSCQPSRLSCQTLRLLCLPWRLCLLRCQPSSRQWVRAFCCLGRWCDGGVEVVPFLHRINGPRAQRPASSACGPLTCLGEGGVLTQSLAGSLAPAALARVAKPEGLCAEVPAHRLGRTGQ
jgi:hypothetical protein